MSNKVFFGVVVALIVVVLGGAVFLNKKDTEDSKTKPADVAAVSAQDHVEGDEDAQVTLIEYGDFQCPYCGAVHPILEQVLPEYEGEVKFVYRHFPLASIHPNSLVAHKAAEAASMQDKFWEMHDVLYEKQEEWSTSDKPIDVFKKYAKQLNLDVDQFEKDFSNEKVTDIINKMKDSGEAAGVESTPTIFLNGEKIDAPRSADELKQAIDKAVKQAKVGTKKTDASKSSN